MEMQKDNLQVPSSCPVEANSRIRSIWFALEKVTDPEIPVISVVEMGMIASVRVIDARVVVDMTPTFAGCPALDLIRSDITKAITDAGEPNVEVRIVYDPPWTSDRITEIGRQKLKQFGLSPPRGQCSGGESTSLERVACAYCGSTDTQLESIFGPTLCRSSHYCNACLQPFEHFKEV